MLTRLELLQDQCSLVWTLLSRCLSYGLQKCHKQAGFFSFPGQRAAYAMLSRSKPSSARNPSILSAGRNNDSMLVVDLRNIFSLEDDYWLYFWTIPAACHYHCNSILLISCGADFYGFLTHVVDCTVWWDVKSEWSCIHVSNEMERVTVFFTAINDSWLEDIVPRLFSVKVTEHSSSWSF